MSRSSTLLCTAVAAAILCSTTTARAQPGATPLLPPAEPSQDAPQPERYHSHTLLADGLGLAALIAGGLSEGQNGRDTDMSDFFFTAGILTSLFATPIIHMAHGNWENAGKSALLRLTVPGLVGMFAMALDTCSTGADAVVPCQVRSMGPGVMVGIGIVAVIDAIALAKQSRRLERPRPLWSPTIAPTRGGATLGLAALW